MKKSFALLFSFVAVFFSSCDNYIDITPKGAITVDSAYTYYELVATPMRCYFPSHFMLLSDNQWAKESNIIGYEEQSMDGIHMTTQISCSNPHQRRQWFHRGSGGGAKEVSGYGEIPAVR